MNFKITFLAITFLTLFSDRSYSAQTQDQFVCQVGTNLVQVNGSEITEYLVLQDGVLITSRFSRRQRTLDKANNILNIFFTRTERVNYSSMQILGSYTNVLIESTGTQLIIDVSDLYNGSAVRNFSSVDNKYWMNIKSTLKTNYSDQVRSYCKPGQVKIDDLVKISKKEAISAQ